VLDAYREVGLEFFEEDVAVHAPRWVSLLQNATHKLPSFAVRLLDFCI
jgi:hypothetical protein